MISYNEANEMIENIFQDLKPGTETVSLHDSLNRTLAEDIFADSDFPSFDYSSMDGYGIQLNGESTSWKIKDEISAGNFQNTNIENGYAVSIMTGAKIPDKVNAVIPLEYVVRSGENISLRPDVKIREGMYIRRKGEDCKINAKVISTGTQITSAIIPVLSGCGKAEVNVLKKLTIGIIATGDELIEFSSNPINDQVRATNNESLFGQIKTIHQLPEMYGILKDDKKEVQKSLEDILTQPACPDILITTGGVSAGDKDYIPLVLKDIGVNIHFWKVYIKPGKPLLFGSIMKNGKTIFIFGLPGNPVSAFVCFRIFVQPVIEKIYGQNKIDTIPAEILSEIKKPDGKRNFIRGNITYNKTGMKYTALPIENQSSGNLSGLGMANCLIVIPEDIINLKKGSTAECILI